MVMHLPRLPISIVLPAKVCVSSERLFPKRPHTACVDARDLKGHIGDNVHFDTDAQNAIGRRYAEQLKKLAEQK
jgi:hypothetical protein